MLKMDADNAQSVVKLVDAAQENANRLAGATSGTGSRLDITI